MIENIDVENIDKEKFNHSIKISEEFATHIMRYFATESEKMIPRDVYELDQNHGYYFTLHTFAKIVQKICYTIELNSLISGKTFIAEKCLLMINNIVVELMKNKKEDFNEISKMIVKQFKENNNVGI